MSTPEALGVTVTRSWQAWPKNVQGKPVEGGTTTFALVLPRSTNVRATFATKGLSEKFLELFAHEITTGDAVFDHAVHVTTATPAETTALLGRPELREYLVRVLKPVRPIELAGPSVTLRVEGSVQADDPRLAELLELLLSTAP